MSPIQWVIVILFCTGAFFLAWWMIKEKEALKKQDRHDRFYH